jgi:hypothetical protein
VGRTVRRQEMRVKKSMIERVALYYSFSEREKASKFLIDHGFKIVSSQSSDAGITLVAERPLKTFTRFEAGLGNVQIIAKGR